MQQLSRSNINSICATYRPLQLGWVLEQVLYVDQTLSLRESGYARLSVNTLSACITLTYFTSVLRDHRRPFVPRICYLKTCTGMGISFSLITLIRPRLRSHPPDVAFCLDAPEILFACPTSLNGNKPQLVPGPMAEVPVLLETPTSSIPEVLNSERFSNICV